MLANIGRSTVYKILNGKQLPEQDMLLRMAFVLELSARETQHLLKAGHRAQLTSSRPRDIVIIAALQNHLSLDEVDELLMERDLTPLTPIEKKLSEFLTPFMKNVSFDQLLRRAHLNTPSFLKLLRHAGPKTGLDALDAVSADLEQDDLIKIAFALHLKSSEVQRMLRICHRAFLNTTDARDYFILDGLSSGVTLEEMDAVLKFHHIDPLI